MPKFEYKAVDMTGRNIEGVFEAINKDTVAKMLKQRGFYHTYIGEIVEKKDLTEVGFLSKIPTKDIYIFCRQFGTVLKAGVSMLKALEIIGLQAENKMLKKVLIQVREEVQKGNSLSDSMRLFENKFPPMLINMVEAGEVSGTLDDSLETMAVHYEKEYKLGKKVKGAMIYPIVIMLVAIAAVIFLMVGVVPMFVNMFASSGAELPLPTKILLGISNFLTGNWLVIIVVIVLSGIAIRLFAASENGRFTIHRMILDLPIIGRLQNKINTARFSRTMGSLMMTGIDITQAINITGKVITNTVVQKKLKDVETQLIQGVSLYQSINSIEIFPPMLENMILLGEESGTLDEMMQKTADFYEEEVDRGVESMTALIEPAIIIFLGGIVAFIVLSILLPMFGMMDLIA
ncbi:MAG: type II secretion system F family protein [Clostridiales bacterium]|nr:type II secretion system F family protein [Clostridiales bacterium]